MANQQIFSRQKNILIFFLVNLFIYLTRLRLILTFKKRCGYWPNVAIPSSYHEKMLWFKIFELNPLFTILSNKIAVKAYIKLYFPDIPVASVLWTGKDASDIPESIANMSGVLKSNHASGHVLQLPVDNKEWPSVVKRANRWISKPYGKRKGEWAYWGIPRRIFVEEEIRPHYDIALFDYKFYTVAGYVVCAWVGQKSLTSGLKRAWVVDRGGIDMRVKTLKAGLAKPVLLNGAQFSELVLVVERMAKDLGQVRIDFIRCGNRFYFGEYTFYTMSGFDWLPTDRLPLLNQLESRWQLDKSWFARQKHKGLIKLYAELVLNGFCNRGLNLE